MKTLLTALTEANRLHIVELLRDGPLTVGEITERLGLQQPQVSKHLKVLNEADIVEVQPQANRRIYQLRREPFQELEVCYTLFVASGKNASIVWTTTSWKCRLPSNTKAPELRTTMFDYRMTLGGKI
jgi:DNA-binding transcriptional ArsR family regulator